MATDKPCLHLPLDEIRIDEETATAHNVGGVGGDALVRGNPKILHDPTMGTCMRFDGEGDFVELSDPSSATFAQGLTAMAWVRFEETPYFSRIFDLNVAQIQKAHIVWAGNEERSQHLAFEINGVRFRVDDGVALRQWRHYAFVYDPAGKVSILVDGAVAFSQVVAFDVAGTAWQTGYVGKSSHDYDSLFRGGMAHFRLYNHALTRAEIKDLMDVDRSAMAHYRETTLLKVDLYTIRDDDHKPILYVEAENKGEPLEVNLANPTGEPVAWKSFSAPTAGDFHVQLRFRRNVIAPGVLRALQSAGGVAIDGWQHAAGTTADGREDYISFLKTEAPFVLDKGKAWRIRIPDFSAAAQGGARNTRVQVRYRTEPQDPGSVVRHMEVQSHLGLKTIPLIARIRGSNTILNNGTTTNELTVEVVYTSDTGSVRLDDTSRFELIVDDDLRSVMVDGAEPSVGSLEAVSRGASWLEAQPALEGVGHETIAFEVKRPENGEVGDEPAPLLEVPRDNPLTFELSNWVTNKPSGMYNILLRYQNIPGYWDGAWVLPVQLSPLLLRSDKIGIGTDEPGAELEIRKDLKGKVGPVLRLTNGEGGEQSGAAIDFNVGPHGQGAAHEPTVRIEGRNDAHDRTDLVFVGKSAPDKDSALEEKARITAEGRVKDRMGYIMPVGAILAYGGFLRKDVMDRHSSDLPETPEGWLLCDGSAISHDRYPELYDVLKNPDQPGAPVLVPDLRSRFIIGANPSTPEHTLNKTGGSETHTLKVEELPKHSHGGTTNSDGAHSHTGQRTHGADNDDNDHRGQYIGYNDYDNGNYRRADDGTITSSGSSHSHSFTTDIVGSEWAHNNMPPFYALTYIIKY